MNVKELLYVLLSEPAESEWLEFKVNNDQPELIGQYISALSNSACLHKEQSKMERKDKVRATYQHCCLRWVCRDFMSNATLRLRMGIEEKNYSSASRIIKDTIEAGLIKVSDPDNKSNKKKYIPYWA